jgi:hypothetical protein
MDMHAHLACRRRLSVSKQPTTATEHRLAYSNRPAAWASMV